MAKKRLRKGERWGCYEDKRDWKAVDEKLVKRGEFYLDIEFVESWDEDTKRMNRGKRGRPFRYPEAFIAWMSVVHVFFCMPYRQMQGFAERLSRFIPLKSADYTTLFKRIAAASLPFDASLLDCEDMVVALDSSGFRVTNRGEWINRVGMTGRERKGWLRVHIAVNVESKEVLALEVTREEVRDHACFEGLVMQSLEHGTVKQLLADGGYDSRGAFNLLDDLGIEPGIKTRENATTNITRDGLACPLRAKTVRYRKRYGYKTWSKKTGYGQRWNVESVFSALKRIFRETLSARSWQGMIREIHVKMAMYNLLLSL
jgi:Transposase DDE domain